MSQVMLVKTEMMPAGELRQFNVGETVLLLINAGGWFYCLAARCTHAGAPLEEGRLDGHTLICPWHGSNFRINDGAVLKGPAERPLKVYPVTVKDGSIFVEL